MSKYKPNSKLVCLVNKKRNEEGTGGTSLKKDEIFIVDLIVPNYDSDKIIIIKVNENRQVQKTFDFYVGSYKEKWFSTDRKYINRLEKINNLIGK